MYIKDTENTDTITGLLFGNLSTNVTALKRVTAVSSWHTKRPDSGDTWRVCNNCFAQGNLCLEEQKYMHDDTLWIIIVQDLYSGKNVLKIETPL